jgi:hypothetical protein
MQRLIDAKEDALHAQLQPRDELEATFIEEIACASIQARVCEGYVELDKRRVREEADLCWDDARRTDINAMAERLGKAPHRVAHLLEQSLQGAQYCLEHWIGLGDSVEANGKLTEAQRHFAFDLLGVGLMSRDGTKRVPAADDAERLLALVQQQVKRLETRIECELKSRDLRAKARARHGLPTPPDAETRRVQSNFARANKRLKWATEMFWRVRLGLALGQPLDPELCAAVLKTPQGQAQAQAPQTAEPAPTAAPPEPASVDPDNDVGDPRDNVPFRIPDKITGEDREALIVGAAMLRSMLLETPLSAHLLPRRSAVDLIQPSPLGEGGRRPGEGRRETKRHGSRARPPHQSPRINLIVGPRRNLP